MAAAAHKIRQQAIEHLRRVLDPFSVVYVVSCNQTSDRKGNLTRSLLFVAILPLGDGLPLIAAIERCEHQQVQLRNISHHIAAVLGMKVDAIYGGIRTERDAQALLTALSEVLQGKPGCYVASPLNTLAE